MNLSKISFPVVLCLCVIAINVVNADAQTSNNSAQGRQIAASTVPMATNNLQILRSEAYLLFTASQYNAAADAYGRLIQLGSSDPSDCYWFGESLYHLNNFQQAANAFEQALQINPRFEQAFTRLAETYLALHQKDKAKQVCDRALPVIIDTYRHQQMEALLRVSVIQEKKPLRPREQRPNRFPSES